MDGQNAAPPPYDEAVSPPHAAYPLGFEPQPINAGQVTKGDHPPQGVAYVPPGGPSGPQGGAFMPPGGAMAPQGGAYSGQAGSYHSPAGAYGGQGATVIQTGFTQPIHQPILRSMGNCPPPDYTVFAAIVTFLCCLPIGLVGLMKALEARNRWQVGDVEGAHQSALEAKRWSTMGLISGVIIMTVLVIIIIVMVAI